MIAGQNIIGNKTLMLLRKNLLYYRKRILRLSLEDMSSEIRVSRETLYRLENNGDTEKPIYPTLKTLIILAEYLDVGVGDLLSKDMEMDDIERQERINKIERLGDSLGSINSLV